MKSDNNLANVPDSFSRDACILEFRNNAYESAGEYMRDLIRLDKERDEAEAFDRLKAELPLAFAAPEERCNSLTATEVISRNRK